jgi:hypothetical protein
VGEADEEDTELTDDERILLACAEVLEEVLAGRLPVDVASFSALHDHFDANELGGLCDDGFCTGDDWVGRANRIQDAVDQWIKSGGIEKSLLAVISTVDAVRVGRRFMVPGLLGRIESSAARRLRTKNAKGGEG